MRVMPICVKVTSTLPKSCRSDMPNLWSLNTPQNFWHCTPNPPDQVWQKAIEEALPVLQADLNAADLDSILAWTLGEARFGPDRWQLSPIKQVYYILKPFLPRALTRQLRRLYRQMPEGETASIPFPCEDRYARFLWRVIEIISAQVPYLHTRPLWPADRRFALILTHDIETAEGQRFAHVVADLEEGLGFRSSFNFVPERYPIDKGLVDELRRRGFEIGIHGLKHDGKLFRSRAEFERRAVRINHHLKEMGVVGFRSPLTHRNPEWMQALEIEYDLSFFDTDPFEPMPGGTMSLWPFFIGHFVELPYTLVQDYTLTDVLNETSPSLWLDKVDFICKYQGMALLNSHPDYLKSSHRFGIYSTFLDAMHEREDAWHALPREAARWWRSRSGLGEAARFS